MTKKMTTQIAEAGNYGLYYQVGRMEPFITMKKIVETEQKFFENPREAAKDLAARAQVGGTEIDWISIELIPNVGETMEQTIKDYIQKEIIIDTKQEFWGLLLEFQKSSETFEPLRLEVMEDGSTIWIYCPSLELKGKIAKFLRTFEQVELNVIDVKRQEVWSLKLT